MEKNYYIEHVDEIAKLANEKGEDWFVAVDIYDQEYGLPSIDSFEITRLRREFYEYVSGRKYDAEGKEIVE